ncbi:hypothetical protein [Halomonas sp. A29]|uniref:hypothetical protein n=1 Tax=Halomonas sp. A29 TaxID=3102786 RepID=UPI00398B6554
MWIESLAGSVQQFALSIALAAGTTHHTWTQEIASMTEQQPPPLRFWLVGKRAAEQDRFFR